MKHQRDVAIERQQSFLIGAAVVFALLPPLIVPAAVSARDGRADIIGISIGSSPQEVLAIVGSRKLKLSDSEVGYKVNPFPATNALLPEAGEFMTRINANSLTPPMNFDDPSETIEVTFYSPPTANGVSSIKRRQTLGNSKARLDELRNSLEEKYGHPSAESDPRAPKVSFVWFWTREGRLHPTKPSGQLNYAIQHPCAMTTPKDDACGDSLVVHATQRDGLVDNISSELFNNRADAAAKAETSKALNDQRKGTVGAVPDL